MWSQSPQNHFPEHIHPVHSTFYCARHLERNAELGISLHIFEQNFLTAAVIKFRGPAICVAGDPEGASNEPITAGLQSCNTSRGAMARARDGLATRADSRVLTVSFHDPTLVRVEHAAKRHVAQIGEEDLARSYRGFRPVKTIIQRESRHWMHSMKGHLPLRPDRGLLLWRDSITSASGF